MLDMQIFFIVNGYRYCIAKDSLTISSDIPTLRPHISTWQISSGQISNYDLPIANFMYDQIILIKHCSSHSIMYRFDFPVQHRITTQSSFITPYSSVSYANLVPNCPLNLLPVTIVCHGVGTKYRQLVSKSASCFRSPRYGGHSPGPDAVPLQVLNSLNTQAFIAYRSADIALCSVNVTLRTGRLIH